MVETSMLLGAEAGRPPNWLLHGSVKGKGDEYFGSVEVSHTSGWGPAVRDVMHPSSSALASWKVQGGCCPSWGGFGGARPAELEAELCWRSRVVGRQGAGAAGPRASCPAALQALPVARGGVLTVQGGCAGSGTHLRRAGRGFRNCWRGGGSSDDPLLAKEDPMI